MEVREVKAIVVDKPILLERVKYIVNPILYDRIGRIVSTSTAQSSSQSIRFMDKGKCENGDTQTNI